MLMTSPATSLTRKQPSATSSVPTADLHQHIYLFSSILPFRENEVSKVLCTNGPTTCLSDHIPFHLQQTSQTLLPTLTYIINISLATGKFQSWLQSYLTGKSFSSHEGESKSHQLITGVPQGLVPAPLLFSIYTT